MPKNDKSPVRIGSIVDHSRVKFGAPPIVLQAQAYGRIPMETPEQLRQWQDDLKTFHGISLDASRMAGIACETCSNGCSDMCDIER